jgi:hypothetical protein
MTLLAALRHDRIDAPWFIEGPIDGASFRTYVEKVLLPTLRPGDIGHGQSRQPQKQARALAPSVRRRQAVLPAKIVARPESDRTDTLPSSNICFGRQLPEPLMPYAPPSAKF